MIISMKFKLIVLAFLLLSNNIYAQNYNFTKETTTNKKLENGAPMVGLNFVSSIPNNPFGISIPVFFKNSNIGVYGDIKSTLSNEGVEGVDLTDSLTKNQVDNFLKHPYLGVRETMPILFNLGVTIKSKSKNIVYYVALGAHIRETYHQYFDPTKTWSTEGNYHILASRTTKLNFTTGAMYIFENGLILQGGFDTTPLGLNLGVGFVFSRYH